MKHHALPLLVLALALVSCQEKPVIVPAFTAVVGEAPDGSVRTEYGQDGLVWSEGDHLSVFVGNNANVEYFLTTGAGTAEATFARTEGVSYLANYKLDRNYALYPYDEGTTISREAVITSSLPQVQHYVKGSFAPGAFPMVAVTAGTDELVLRFRNLCSAIKFNIKGSTTLKSIELSGNNNEPLSGTATIVAAYGEAPVLTMAEGASASVKLDCGEGVKLSSFPTDFWVVIPPTTFTKGMTVVLTAADGRQMTYSLDSEVDIPRNCVQPVEAFHFRPKGDADHFTVGYEQLPSDINLWEAGTQLRVFDGEGVEHLLTLDPASAGQKEGRFEDASIEDYTQQVTAVWPASLDVHNIGGALEFEMPQVLYPLEGKMDPASMPQVGRSASDGTMTLRQVAGVLAVTVDSRVPMSALRLTSFGNAPLWGKAKVEIADDGTPKLTMQSPDEGDGHTLILNTTRQSQPDASAGTEMFVTGGNSSVTEGLIPGGPTGMVTYYFVVPEAALADGFNLTLLDNAYGFMEEDWRSAKIVRAESTPMAVSYVCASDAEARTDVINKAFYKDIFMDSGISVTSNTSMPVVEHLGLSLEYFRADGNNATTRAMQTAIYAGSIGDANGRILYPDGAPRYRMVYVNGGSSATHGYTLESEGRERYRQFVHNGGSYLGSCAGAYLATQGYQLDYIASPDYLGLWPSHCNRLSTPNFYVEHSIPADSPLLKYYDFSGRFHIDSIRHHNGPCFIDWATVPGTEVLSIFDYPDRPDMHGNPTAIAYKADKWTGRVIPCGSHPEQSWHPDNLGMMIGMVKYCFDGVGNAKVKGNLRNGQVRRMVRNSLQNDPDFTVIGDKQCHHFLVAIPSTARNIRFRLEALSDFHLSLMLAKDTFAFTEDAQYRSSDGGRVQELTFDRLERGLWYVGVQCEDTVTVSDPHGTYGTVYTDTNVLNGVPYTICVTWDY